MNKNIIKKVAIIFGFILIVIFLGYLLFLFFFKTPEEIVQNPPTSTSSPNNGLPLSGKKSPDSSSDDQQTIDTLPSTPAEILNNKKPSSVARGDLTKTSYLTKNPALGVAADSADNILYYDKSKEKFYRVSNDGNITALSDRIFHNVQKVTWSPTKDNAILEYPDGSNIIYNFISKKQITLPRHWEDFNFSANGDKIAMKSIGLDPSNRWLAVSSADGSAAKPIEAIGENADNVYPMWSPNEQVVALYTEGIDFNRQNVYFVGQHNENFKSTVIEGRGFQPKWSPDGKRLLYSVYSSDNNQKPLLWTVNADGENIGTGRKNLRIETFANKCAFSNTGDNLFCAVPDYLPEGAGLFPELADSSVDKIYKINMNTYTKKMIAIPDSAFTIKNIMISENENYLFFTDAQSGRIHKINLK